MTLHIDFEIPTEEFFNRIGRKQTLVLLQPHPQSFQIFSHGSVTSHPITTFQPPPVELVDSQGRSRSKSSTLNLD